MKRYGRPIILASASPSELFNEPDIKHNQVCVVLPLVRRYASYQPQQLDIDVFIKHNQVTELGQLEMYRVKDYIR